MLSFYFSTTSVHGRDSSLSHEVLGDLSQVCQVRSVQDLLGRDISIHTIETAVVGDHRVQIDHEFNQSLVVICLKFSPLPHLGQFTFVGHNHRIDLDLVWSIGWIFKYFLH